MAHVSGPTSTLPGSQRAAPAGTMCDDHPDRPATTRVQGETDSFGAEYIDMCAECLATHDAQMQATEAERARGACDWCSQAATDLRHHRDADEGSSGRLYRVCGACRRNDAASYDIDRVDHYDMDDLADDDDMEMF